MNACRQSGATLAEAAVALAIVSLVAGSVLAALLPASHHLAGDARSAALQRLCDRAVREARDVLKYDGSSVTARAVSTTVPVAGASPLAATVELLATKDASSTTIVVTATAADGAFTAQARATIAARAPQPGRTYAPAAPVAAPTGAP